MNSRRNCPPGLIHLSLAGIVLLSIWASLQMVGWPGARYPDEHAYLLAGKTFAEGRLTNPTPDHAEFFETQHVLLAPSYQSKYPPGIGLQLALGILLGDPIFGVWLTVGLCVSLCYATARRFLPPVWSYASAVYMLGVYLAFNFTILSYWGGSLFLLGGILYLDGCIGLGQGRAKAREWLGFGLGAGIMSLSRPFEGLLFCLMAFVPVLFCLVRERIPRGEVLRALACGCAVAACFVVFHLFYNWRVTGSPVALPWKVYGAATGRDLPVFSWGSMADHTSPSVHAELEEVRRVYERAIGIPWSRYGWQRLLETLQLLTPVWLVLPVTGLFLWRNRSVPPLFAILFGITFGALLLPIISFNFAFQFWERYIAAWYAPASILFVFALHTLWTLDRGRRLARVVAMVFMGWAVIIAYGRAGYLGGYAGTSVDLVKELRVETEAVVESEPEAFGEGLIVFYEPTSLRLNLSADFVYNGPDPLNQPVIWARYIDPERNRELLEALPQHSAWVLRFPVEGAAHIEQLRVIPADEAVR